jgi:hypothetical protein
LFKYFQAGAIGYTKAKSMPNNFIAIKYYLKNDKKALKSPNILLKTELNAIILISIYHFDNKFNNSFYYF